MSVLDIIATLKKNKVIPRIENGQLKLVGQTQNLSAEFMQILKAKKKDLILFLNNAIYSPNSEQIPLISKQSSYPLSSAQKRMWVLTQIDGGGEAYNLLKCFYLKGVLINENFKRALQITINRHDSLRTIFNEFENEIRQIVLDEMLFDYEFVDLFQHPNVRTLLKNKIKRAAHWKYDLKKGPLIRVKLFKLSSGEFALIFGIHHIISDGWSINVIVNEVMNYYERICKDEYFEPHPPKIQYKDYTAWLDIKNKGISAQTARNFWINEFPQDPPSLDLPMDFQRPAIKSFEGSVSKFYFERELYSNVIEFCKEGTTPFNFFRAILTILLSKLSGQDKIILGTPVSGRNHFDLEDQIGLYVNTLPLWSEININSTFDVFLSEIAENSFKVFEFQDYPLDYIIEDVHVKRDISRNPLFDVMIVLQSIAGNEKKYNSQYGFVLSPLDHYLYKTGVNNGERRAVKFDLTFNFDYDPDGKFYLDIEYATSLFTKARIDFFFDAYKRIIEQVLFQPKKRLSSIEIISDIDKQKILKKFNRPIKPIHTLGIADLFEKSFLTYSFRPAIIRNSTVVTYGDLNTLSDSIAVYLGTIIKKRNPFIGLLMDRSEWVIISIIGILKAGAAYIPIDLNYPVARINFIINDAQPQFIIVDNNGLKVIPSGFGGIVIHLDVLKKLKKQTLGVSKIDFKEYLAYVIYTSGSTGKPKGVEICHRNTISFLMWAFAEFSDNSFDILYATTSYCFDLSVFEFLYPLTVGKAIRLLDSALEIPNWISFDKKVLINTVPSVVASLIAQKINWQNISVINMAGETVSTRLVEEFRNTSIIVRNLYGPTESTTYSTIYQVNYNELTSVPIGKPIDFTHLYILDPSKNLLPVGINGEIYLSGQTVAKGYLNQPDLTIKCFVENPFLSGFKMYKTGDVGKWDADGNVEFIGRKDDQVKIRGYRIELGEIENILEKHNLIQQAIVIAKKNGDETQLIAYYKGDNKITAPILSQYLEKILPRYMIPALFVRLNEFPLNINGKIDKKNLPWPVKIDSGYLKSAKAENELEIVLLRLWHQIIDNKNIGVNSDFFEIGGNSLKAMILKSLILHEIGREVTISEIFKNPTIRKLAVVLEKRAYVGNAYSIKTLKKTFYPISFAQERLWSLLYFENASVAYNMPVAFRVSGEIKRDDLEKAFKIVIQQNEILRTVFTVKKHGPCQIIKPAYEVINSIEEIKFDDNLTEEQETDFLRSRWLRSFNFENGPLIDSVLIKTPKSTIFSLNIHHLICDGWSIVILVKKILEAYKKITLGEPYLLPKFESQFKEYSIWERAHLKGRELKRQQEFWKEIFRDGLPTLDLPTDFYRPKIKTYNGYSYKYQYDESTTKKVHRLAKDSGVTLFITLLASVNLFLHKYANGNDIVLGTTLAGRKSSEFHDQIGLFATTLPIRTRIEKLATFKSFLLVQKEIFLKVLEHQDFPFELLVNTLELKRDLSRSPLFDVMIVLQNIDGLDDNEEISFSDSLQIKRIPIISPTAKYDLTFNFSENTKGLHLTLEYNTDLFSETTIARMVDYLNGLIAKVIKNPERPINEIEILNRNQKNQLIKIFNNKSRFYDKEKNVKQLFEEQVELHPQNTAIIFEQKQLTYKQLNEKSNQLAHYLKETYRIRENDIIGIQLERTEWMIISIIGVLKAGGAYMPLDLEYPKERIDFILINSKCKLVIDKSVLDIFDNNLNKYPKTNPQSINQPNDLVYVIYTSGSTGQPKGAMVKHHSFTNLNLWFGRLLNLQPDDSILLMAPVSFDLAQKNIFATLIFGAQLCLPRTLYGDYLELVENIEKNKITVVNSAPSAFYPLLDVNINLSYTRLRSLKNIVLGGEPIRINEFMPWIKSGLFEVQVTNSYGPTECTDVVSFYQIKNHEWELLKNIPVGVPIDNVELYILGEDLELAPIGIIGEIFIGGDCVGSGYLNQPLYTKERFINNPFKKGALMYKSGDMGKRLQDGNIEFIERKDGQVKIRGHRVELSEIENKLQFFPFMTAVVVLARKNKYGENDLVAYFKSERILKIEEIRIYLNKLLPPYMIPAHFVQLESFPLTPSGKIDKRNFPVIEDINFDAITAYVAPKSSTEKELVKIWQEILNRKKIGINDDFFELGGHSLKAARIVSKIHELYGVKIDMKGLFNDPTISYLSDYIETLKWMGNKNELLKDDEEMTF